MFFCSLAAADCLCHVHQYVLIAAPCLFAFIASPALYFENGHSVRKKAAFLLFHAHPVAVCVRLLITAHTSEIISASPTSALRSASLCFP